jgi:hypothetical protein
MATQNNQASSMEDLSADLVDKADLKDIVRGKVIPIISNSFRMEQIFSSKETLLKKISETPKKRSTDEAPTVYQQLTKVWADSINYPLPDDSNLARVAQYFQVYEKKNQVALAKEEYLDFLKGYFLNPASPDSVAPQTFGKKFSDIVSESPLFPDEQQDPLQKLANLPLPIYITTSCFDFLERALQLAGKQAVRTQVCSWSGGKASGADLPDPDFEPSAEKPVVYHLFGLENYPTTLVLSEDDYMDWQTSVTEDLLQPMTNTTPPGIPLRLRDALSEKQSKLMILGYNLQDWEFRVLFRFILRFRRGEDLRESTVIQLEPRPKNTEYAETARGYLQKYFEIRKSNVKWSKAETYIHRLAEEYNKYIRGGR